MNIRFATTLRSAGIAAMAALALAGSVAAPAQMDGYCVCGIYAPLVPPEQLVPAERAF